MAVTQSRPPACVLRLVLEVEVNGRILLHYRVSKHLEISVITHCRIQGSLIFMQFSAKILPTNRFSASRAGAPMSGKS